jgi:hypothetical protein
MIAADVVAEIEARFPCVQGFYAAHCQTGDAYLIFASRGGPESEAELCEALLRWFDGYAADWWREHPGGAAPTVYWRYDTPHIVWMPDDDPTHPLTGRLVTRLVLSNAPVRWNTLKQYDEARMIQLEREMFPDAKAAQ